MHHQEDQNCAAVRRHLTAAGDVAAGGLAVDEEPESRTNRALERNLCWVIRIWLRRSLAQSNGGGSGIDSASTVCGCPPWQPVVGYSAMHTGQYGRWLILCFSPMVSGTNQTLSFFGWLFVSYNTILSCEVSYVICKLASSEMLGCCSGVLHRGYGSTSVASIKLPANNNVWSIKWSRGLS